MGKITSGKLKRAYFICLAVMVLSFLYIFPTPIFAVPTYLSTFSASTDSGSIGTPVHIALSSGRSVYIRGSYSGTSYYRTYPASGTTGSSVPIYALKGGTITDFVVDGSYLHYSLTGSYIGKQALSSFSYPTSYLLTQSGSGGITLGGSYIYNAKGSTLYKLSNSGASYSLISTTSLSKTSSRIAYASPYIYYFNVASKNIYKKNLTDLSEPESCVATLNTSNHKGLYASSAGVLTYADGDGSITKISPTGNVLWRFAPSGAGTLSNIRGMAVSSTGNIMVVLSSGAVKRYAAINSVTGLSAVQSTLNNTVTLSWYSSSVPTCDFTGVTIRRSTSSYPSSATSGTAVTANLMGTTSFVDTDVTANTTYYYTVYSRTSDGFYSEGTRVQASTLDIVPPEAPTSFGATAIGSTVTLSWGPNSDISSVKILRGTTTFPTISSGNLVVSGNTGTAQTDTGLIGGTYKYSLYARDSAGNYAAVVTASVIVAATPPAVPTSFSATASGSTVNLSWVSNSDISSVKILRGTSTFPTISSGNLVVSGNTGTTQSDTSLIEGTYKYPTFKQQVQRRPREETKS